MKVLITGASGTLGQALCRQLGEKYEVVGLCRPDFDLKDKNGVLVRVKKENPDVLIHTAALTNVDYCQNNPDEAYEVNAKGTANLCEAIKGKNCLFIHISTDYVFDGTKKGVYIETDKPNPINIYAKTKLEAEKIVSSSTEKNFILRVSWLFGKKGKDFVSMVVEKIKKNESLSIICDKFSVPTYAFDLVFAIEVLFKQDQYGIYNLANSGSCSWFEWAKKIVEYYGVKSDVQPTQLEDFNFSAERPKNTVLNCDKFFNLTGMRLRSWQEAVKEYIEKCYKQ